MLRVFKPTSPMSVGVWILVRVCAAAAAAAALAERATGGAPAPARRPRQRWARRCSGRRRLLHGGADRQHGDAGLARGAPRDAVRVRRLGRQRRGRARAAARAARENAPAVRLAVIGAPAELVSRASCWSGAMGIVAETLPQRARRQADGAAEALTLARASRARSGSASPQPRGRGAQRRGAARRVGLRALRHLRGRPAVRARSPLHGRAPARAAAREASA